MLLVNVHELDVVLADPVLATRLEHDIDDIGGVFRLYVENIIVPCCAEDLGQGAKVNTESDVSIAAVARKSVGLERHRDEGYVGVVHGLKVDTGIIAVEVAVLHKVFDSINHLQLSDTTHKARRCTKLTFLKRLACVKRASSTTTRLAKRSGCSCCQEKHLLMI
jgi:hypothetical protein